MSRDAVGSETIVNAEIGKEEFTATGLVILERNYLDVYVYDRWSGKEIHNYEAGHIFTPTELSLHEGATNPPSMLTEADLIALMEKHGIGTDATHADHINTIKERGYIGELDQGHLVPGTLGMGLVEGYELMNLQLAQPKLRAGLEEDLKAICLGTRNPEDVLREQIEKYKECYQIITREAAELDRALGQRFGQQPQAAVHVVVPVIQELFKCPKCRNSSMILKQKRDNSGYFISCQGFPACRNAIWFANEVKEIVAVDEVCNCGAKKVKLKFAQISMLGMVDEVQGRSRIEGSHFITCLVCDDRLRRLLNIPTESVKILGNVVAAGTRPVQQQNPRDPPARNFGTSATPPPPASGQNRRGWYNSDDDDDRPMGGGAVSAASIRNQEDQPNYHQNRSHPPQNQGYPPNRPQNQGYPPNQPTNQGYQPIPPQNQGYRPNQPRNQGHPQNTPNPPKSTPNSAGNSKSFNLSKLPVLNCKCNTPANKLLVKQGVNTGRPFYGCPTRTCGFFQWGDQNLPAGVQSAVTKRKCGICRQEGHNKKNCPNVSNF